MAAPQLDSPCDGPVTYPGDTKILVKSSKGRSGPTLSLSLNPAIPQRNENLYQFGKNINGVFSCNENTNVRIREEETRDE